MESMTIKIGKYDNFSLILLRMIRIIFILACISFFLVSCKKHGCTDSQAENFNSNANEDDGSCSYSNQSTLEIDIIPKYGDEILYLDSVYTTAEGYLVKFTDFKFYITKLGNGSNVFSEAALFDFNTPQNSSINTTGDVFNFTSLSGIIGVDSLNNHNDPSAFDNDSPLNISNAGLMHWGWNPGYIFVNIIGKVDTLAIGNTFDHNFIFHIGTDQFKRNFEFTDLIWSPSEQGHELQFEIDLKTFLNNNGSAIDLKNEFFTHSGSSDLELTEKLANNFMNALKP